MSIFREKKCSIKKNSIEKFSGHFSKIVDFYFVRHDEKILFAQIFFYMLDYVSTLPEKLLEHSERCLRTSREVFDFVIFLKIIKNHEI